MSLQLSRQHPYVMVYRVKYGTIPYGTVPYRTIPYCAIWRIGDRYGTVPYRTGPCCTVLYPFTVRYRTVHVRYGEMVPYGTGTGESVRITKAEEGYSGGTGTVRYRYRMVRWYRNVPYRTVPVR